MRLNLRPITLILAGVTFLGMGAAPAYPSAAATGSTATKPSTHLSEYASALLTEIQEEAVGLQRHADKLRTLTGNAQYSWQTHAYHLDGVKSHINAVGERTAELQQLHSSVFPWQQQAIAKVTAHAAEVAASTQAAIVHLRENPNRHFFPEYRDHLTTIADRSEDVKGTVDKFLDYKKAQEKLHQLRNELELAAD